MATHTTNEHTPSRRCRGLGPRQTEAMELLGKTAMWLSDIGYGLAYRLRRRGLAHILRHESGRKYLSITPGQPGANYAEQPLKF
jgi:hypothetical protein